MQWLVAIFACTVAAGVQAQADDSLPTRVGRVANVQGTLYHAPDDGTGEWSEIALNYPVAQGDNLWAAHDALAEVDYGGGQFRLAGDTNLHVSRLDERQLALFIASGRVIVRVRVLAADDSLRIDTPSTQVELNRPGLYRIDVDPDAQQTAVLVREGEADVAAASGARQVLPGQTAVLTGTANVTADIRNAGRIDAFDTWSAARDRVYEAPRDNAYVSREMVGQYDLDTYGGWQTYAEYGAVWFPTVDPEWAPYRFGHWTWLPGWGYTWVDNAPWGYAPFHYGRWAYINGRWGWCPGAFVARPVWAPALVAWYGGAGWGYSGSYGAPVYGWVPLGWGDPFVPWWRGCTSRCEARYNRPYGVNPARYRVTGPAHLANWTVPGAATAVPATTLTSGRPVAINRVPIATNRPIAPPPLLTRPPAVPPTPLRPGAVRPGNGVPLPAVNAARAAVPPPGGFGRPVPLAPAERPAVPPADFAGRPPLRIDDGRNVLPPASPVERSLRPEPPRPPSAPPAPSLRPSPAPAPAVRPPPSAPLSPVVPERSFRPVPVPPPAARPAPIRVPAPQMPLPQVPVPQTRAPSLPRIAPAPQAPLAPPPQVPLAPAPIRAVPAPAPAAVPAPAGPERPPARVAPAPPRPPGSGS
jgi:hypothetical protein